MFLGTESAIVTRLNCYNYSDGTATLLTASQVVSQLATWIFICTIGNTYEQTLIK